MPRMWSSGESVVTILITMRNNQTDKPRNNSSLAHQGAEFPNQTRNLKSKETWVPPRKEQDWLITDWQSMRTDHVTTQASKKKSAKFFINL